MYITPEQLKARLEGQSNLELRSRKGIGKHAELPRETKVLAGVLAKFDTQSNVAKALGTSQANISHIVNGVGEENKEIQPEIKETISKTEDKVSSKALDVLMSSLDVVEGKLNKENAKDAASIAANMARVVKTFTPNKGESSFAPRILINIHGSKQKSEEDYEVVEVEAASQ